MSSITHLNDQDIQRLQNSQKWVILTGAGVSAESGISTFRDAPDSYWAKVKPELLASATGFRRDKAMVWRWYEERRANIWAAQPNAAHLAIAALEKAGREVLIVTQNVDDLHQRAGSSQIIALHGDIFENPCFACRRPGPRSLEPMAESPRCTHCNGHLRPGVVWFGEQLPEGAYRKATRAIDDADVLVVIGTSGLVYPAAELPNYAAKKRKPVVVINPESTPFDQRAVWKLEMPATQAVKALWPFLFEG